MVENEVRGEVLYDDGKHQFIWLGWDEEEDDGIVNVNQYLVVHDGVGTLLDPGGIHVFSRVVTNIARYIDLERVENIFFSHQDPDVCSGLSLWMGVTPAKVHVSKLWLRFLPHFGTVDLDRLVGIDDRGGWIPWSDGSGLRVVPAHGAPGRRTSIALTGDDHDAAAIDAAVDRVLLAPVTGGPAAATPWWKSRWLWAAAGAAVTAAVIVPLTIGGDRSDGGTVTVRPTGWSTTW